MTRCKHLDRRLFVLQTVLISFVACGDEQEPRPPDVVPDGERVVVSVDPGVAAGELHPRYIGFAFDTAQLTGGTWWTVGAEERSVAETPDLESQKLRRLAAYLAPSTLRIGGTDCDSYYFCPDEGECQLPAAYQDVYGSDDRLESVMAHDDVRRSADFAEAVGSEVLFCLNFGPGPRDPVSGVWSPENGRELIRFVKSLPNGDLFTIWEPGNEINGADFHFDVNYFFTPQRFAEDLLTFRTLIEYEDPDAIVAAPDSYVSPFGEFQNFTQAVMDELSEEGEEPLDAVSWHLYATQSSGCPTQVHPATTEYLFDEQTLEIHRGFARQMRLAAGELPLWNTESASAQCGGQQGLSDTMADALWFTDWIGVMAEEGTSMVVRHSLVGADYSLLEPGSFDPRPTFLALVMMRRTVVGPRLGTAVDRGRLRAHAFCGPDGGGAVTIVLANPSEESLVAQVELTGSSIRAARQWTVSSGGDLAARRATINGEEPADDGTIPEPAGVHVAVVDGVAYPIVEAGGLVFAEIEVVGLVGGCGGSGR